MSNAVTITDADGNLYTLAVPVQDSQCSYTVDKHGYVIVVARFKPPSPQFTLAPAVPTADEKALRKALSEKKTCCVCYAEFEGWGQFCERCDPL